MGVNNQCFSHTNVSFSPLLLFLKSINISLDEESDLDIFHDINVSFYVCFSIISSYGCGRLLIGLF